MNRCLLHDLPLRTGDRVAETIRQLAGRGVKAQVGKESDCSEKPAFGRFLREDPAPTLILSIIISAVGPESEQRDNTKKSRQTVLQQRLWEKV